MILESKVDSFDNNTDGYKLLKSNVSKDIVDSLWKQIKLNILSSETVNIDCKSVLWSNFVCGRIYFVRHGKTINEWNLQDDNEPILISEIESINSLIKTFSSAWLWDNIYLFSNNRTTRIFNTCEHFESSLNFVWIQKDVVSLDTTVKDLPTNVRISITKWISSLFVSEIIDELRNKNWVWVITIIHSSNQNSIEDYYEYSPFHLKNKLKNLQCIEMDVTSSWVLDYYKNNNVYNVNISNINNLVTKLKNYIKDNNLTTNSNSTSSQKIAITNLIELFDTLTNSKIPIWEKQNIFNTFFVTNKELLYKFALFGVDKSFFFFAISHLLTDFDFSQSKLNSLIKLDLLWKIDSWVYTNEIILKLLNLFQSNKSTKYLNLIMKYLIYRSLISDELKIYMKTSNNELYSIYKIQKIKDLLKKSAWIGLILLWVSSYYFHKEYSYWKYFFDNAFKKSDQLKLNKLNYIFVDKDNKYDLDLSHIKSLSTEQLFYLMQLNLNSLDLSWLESIDDNVSKDLSKFKWLVLKLNWLKTITLSQYKDVSNFCNSWLQTLQLNWLESVDEFTSCDILKFGWKYLSIKWIIFDDSISSFVLMSKFLDNTIVNFDMNTISFSDDFLKQTFSLITNKGNLHSYLKNIQEKINKTTIFSSSHNIKAFSDDFVKNIDLSKYKDFSTSYNWLTFRTFSNYVQLVNKWLAKFIWPFALDFFYHNYSKFVHYKIPEIDNNVDKYIQHFEKEFLIYLKDKLPANSYNELVLNINNSNYSLEYHSVVDNNTNSYYNSINSQVKLFNSYLELNNTILINIILSFNDSNLNDNLIVELVWSLQSDIKYSLFIDKTHKISNLLNILETKQVETLILNAIRIDSFPIIDNIWKIYINFPHASKFTNISKSSLMDNFDYWINYPLDVKYYWDKVMHQYIKYFIDKNNNWKWFWLDFNNWFFKANSTLLDSINLVILNKITKLWFTNLYLWNIDLNKYSALISSNFKPQDSRIKFTFQWFTYEEMNNLFTYFDKIWDYKQSYSDELIKIIGSFNINPTKINTRCNCALVDNNSIEFKQNNSILFDWVESINITSLKEFYKNGINVYLLYSIYNNSNYRRIIDLIIDDDLDSSYNLILTLVLTNNLFHNYFNFQMNYKFKPIFQWEPNNDIIDLLKHNNLYYVE